MQKWLGGKGSPARATWRQKAALHGCRMLLKMTSFGVLLCWEKSQQNWVNSSRTSSLELETSPNTRAHTTARASHHPYLIYAPISI